MERKLRIQLGENKEDKYGNRWKAKTICVHKSTQREEQSEREREIEVRARVEENKGDGRIIPKGPCHINIYIHIYTYIYTLSIGN